MSPVPTFVGLHGTKLQVAVAFLAGMDFLLFGYDQGVTGGLLTLKSFTRYFPEIDTSSQYYGQLPPSKQSITVAAYNLGCLFGAIPTIWLGNWLGRRRAIFLGSSIMVVGALLQCAAYHLPQLIVGRIITGFGNGINTSTVPTWQSECCKANRRGQMVMMEGAMITLGITISYWIDFGLLFADPNSIAWRFPLAFQIFFALIIVSFVMFLPESPRWLVLKGRDGEAKRNLSALTGQEPDAEHIQSEFTAIKATVLEMSKGSFGDLFTMGPDRHFHRVVLAYVCQMFQQISGINLITYYIPKLLENLKMGTVNSRLISACNGTEYFLASWLGTPVGNIACTVFMFVFNTCFAIGWLGMTWLYPAEIVPLKIRAPANAVSTSANWTFNFLVVMITPVAFENIGYRTYIIFAVLNAFMFPVVFFFFPETTHRSLEEMDRIFHKTKSVFGLVRTARDEPHAYGKHGELLRNLDDVEDDAVRRASTMDKVVEKTSHETDVQV
ncbi:sugar transporter [Aspergillus sp. HF37]|nr:sugar transporter [Aspergillus sp. HF37]